LTGVSTEGPFQRRGKCLKKGKHIQVGLEEESHPGKDD